MSVWKVGDISVMIQVASVAALTSTFIISIHQMASIPLQQLIAGKTWFNFRDLFGLVSSHDRCQVTSNDWGSWKGHDLNHLRSPVFFKAFWTFWSKENEWSLSDSSIISTLAMTLVWCHWPRLEKTQSNSWTYSIVNIPSEGLNLYFLSLPLLEVHLPTKNAALIPHKRIQNQSLGQSTC